LVSPPPLFAAAALCVLAPLEGKEVPKPKLLPLLQTAQKGCLGEAAKDEEEASDCEDQTRKRKPLRQHG
jgi:hypothetical protein